MLKLIDESCLVSIKKEDSIALIMGRNKGKGKSKEKTGFKCLHCGKMGYKKINCFCKYLKKVSSSWKSRKSEVQKKRNKIADNTSFIFLIIRDTG